MIAEDKEDTKGASLNAKYDTTDNKPATIEKDGVKYYLTEKAVKDDSKPETGDVVEGKTEVTYVYEKARTSSSSLCRRSWKHNPN